MNRIMRKLRNERICFLGLGKVGLPMAIFYASFGYHVVCLDKMKSRIKSLKNNLLLHQEPNFQKMFNKYRNKLSFTANYDHNISQSDIFYIIVPTPSNQNGSFSLTFILEVLKNIANIIRNTNTWKLINIVSTISPGSMDQEIIPYLERITGKTAGKDFGICYSPEFVALGSVIRNLQFPDFILIGQSDEKSGKILARIKKSVCTNNPPVHFSNFINAELAKIASNTFITTKISFTNMLTRICQKSPGANIDTVTDILGDDSSIGRKRLIGSISYGGPCYPRDNLALSAYADKIGESAEIATSTHRFNNKQIDYLVNLIQIHKNQKKKVGILGLSYKPQTDVVNESTGIKLTQILLKKKFKICVYDPLAIPNAKRVLKNKVQYCKSTEEVLKACNSIVITVPWPKFTRLENKTKAKITIIDCWRILEEKYRKQFEYFPLGIGPV